MLVFLFFESLTSKKVHNIMITFVFTVMLLTIADAADYWMSQIPGSPNPLRFVTSAIGYGFKPVPPILITMIIKRHKWKKMPLAFIMPAIFSLAISFISIFTGWVFTFDSENNFERGYLGYFPIIISLGYFVIVLLQAFLDKDAGHERIIIGIIAIMQSASIVFEFLLGYRFFINGAEVVAIILYYLYLSLMIYKRDELTKILNRRAFYVELERLSDTKIGLLSMDMNDLKLINDTHGHLAGDAAIKNFAVVTKSCLDKMCNMYRIGGDEFMIIIRHPEERAENIISKIKETYGQNNVSAAMGYAVYEPGMDISKVISKSDKAMYEDKVRIKLERSSII